MPFANDKTPIILKIDIVTPNDIAPSINPVAISITHRPMHSGAMLFDDIPVNKKNPPFAIMYTVPYNTSASESGKKIRAAAKVSITPSTKNNGLIKPSFVTKLLKIMEEEL